MSQRRIVRFDGESQPPPPKSHVQRTYSQKIPKKQKKMGGLKAIYEDVGGISDDKEKEENAAEPYKRSTSLKYSRTQTPLRTNESSNFFEIHPSVTGSPKSARSTKGRVQFNPMASQESDPDETATLTKQKSRFFTMKLFSRSSKKIVTPKKTGHITELYPSSVKGSRRGIFTLNRKTKKGKTNFIGDSVMALLSGKSGATSGQISSRKKFKVRKLEKAAHLTDSDEEIEFDPLTNLPVSGDGLSLSQKFRNIGLTRKTQLPSNRRTGDILRDENVTNMFARDDATEEEDKQSLGVRSDHSIEYEDSDSEGISESNLKLTIVAEPISDLTRKQSEKHSVVSRKDIDEDPRESERDQTGVSDSTSKYYNSPVGVKRTSTLDGFEDSDSFEDEANIEIEGIMEAVNPAQIELMEAFEDYDDDEELYDDGFAEYLEFNQHNGDDTTGTPIGRSSTVLREDESDLQYFERKKGDPNTRTTDADFIYGKTLTLDDDDDSTRAPPPTLFGPEHTMIQQTMNLGTSSKSTNAKTISAKQKMYRITRDRRRQQKVVVLKNETAANASADALVTTPSKKKAKPKKLRWASDVKSTGKPTSTKPNFTSTSMNESGDSLGIRSRAKQAQSMSHEDQVEQARRFILEKVKLEDNPRSRYKVDKILGKGSFGEVRKCRDLMSNKQVAVKICRFKNDKGLISLSTEINIMQKIMASAFLVRYFDSVRTEDRKLWISMELCEAGDLSTFVEICDIELTEAHRKPVIAAVLLGLEYLHSLNIIHRDVKCANIMLGSNGLPKLGDFGISKQVKSKQVKSMTFAGSPYWMAPEVIRGKHEYNHLCDMWSLGISIIEMVEKNPPLIELDPMDAIKRIVEPEHADSVGVSDTKFGFLFPGFVDILLEPELADRVSASDALTNSYIKDTVQALRLLEKQKYFETSDVDVVGFGRRAGGMAAAVNILEPLKDLVRDNMPKLEKVRERKNKRRPREWAKNRN